MPMPDEMSYEERLKFLRDNAGPLFQSAKTMPDDELLKMDALLSNFDQTEPEEEEKEKEPAVYHFLDAGVEAHMMGEYVAVCWRLTEKTIKIPATKDKPYFMQSTQYVRSGEPYIDFIEIRQYDGEFYIGKDSPVAGGISPAEALIIARELEAACAYLARMGCVDN